MLFKTISFIFLYFCIFILTFLEVIFFQYQYNWKQHHLMNGKINFLNYQLSNLIPSKKEMTHILFLLGIVDQINYKNQIKFFQYLIPLKYIQLTIYHFFHSIYNNLIKLPDIYVLLSVLFHLQYLFVLLIL